MSALKVLAFVGWIVIISGIGFGLVRVTGFFAATTTNITQSIDETIPQSSATANEKQQYEAPKCPDSCDDKNPCTDDYCDETTDYVCASDPLNGTTTDGCYGSSSACQSNLCIEGKCTKLVSTNCCGNNKCETGEACYNCPDDCGTCTTLTGEPIPTYQTPVQPPPATPYPTPQNEQSSELEIHIEFSQNPIVRGNDQTISITVTDGSNKIGAASVSGVVIYASGSTRKDFTSVTDSNGIYNYTWKIGGSSMSGIFKVNVEANKQNYATGIENTTFEVVNATN